MNLPEIARSLGVESYRRHIFLCADQTKPKCCDKTASIAAWDYLKRRLKELNLVGPGAQVFRTKANCLQLCERGPVAVVYPEGSWYHSCTEEGTPHWRQTGDGLSDHDGPAGSPLRDYFFPFFFFGEADFLPFDSDGASGTSVLGSHSDRREITFLPASVAARFVYSIGSD
jgi:hypothetical protein